MAYTAGFSVSVGDPTKASDVTTLAANDDYLKAAVDGKAALSGSTNNTVATVTGANALIGEADLTFAANKLTVFGTTGTGAATASVLNLSTRETTVVDADQLGRIEFQAPAETGSDAVLVAASIYAEADVTFDATNNATDLVLATAHDGAAAERVRITSQGEIGLAGANYGTDGQVMTSAGPNAAVAWETIPPGTTLSGSTNNTIATVTGANALEGEANLTFDGSTLTVAGVIAGTGDLTITQGTDATDGTDPIAVFERTGSSQTGVSLKSNNVHGLILRADSTGFGAIHSKDDLAFYTGTIPGSTYGDVRMRIDAATGSVGIGTTDPDAAAPTGSASPRILKVDGGAAVDAAIQIVGHDNDHGIDLWTDVSTGDVYFDSRGNHANYDIRFRTKTTGTPVDAMTITGNGALSKASGSFKIDHPLPEKIDTHYLVHSFVEGPQADLIYRGTATLSGGTATVNIDAAARMTDGTFVALNGNVQTFTTNETAFDNVRGSVSGNVLTITSSDNSSTATISWLVVGERKDAHMVSADTRWTDSDGRVITEPLKEEDANRMTPARQAAEAEAAAEAKITALESA